MKRSTYQHLSLLVTLCTASLTMSHILHADTTNNPYDEVIAHEKAIFAQRFAHVNRLKAINQAAQNYYNKHKDEPEIREKVVDLLHDTVQPRPKLNYHTVGYKPCEVHSWPDAPINSEEKKEYRIVKTWCCGTIKKLISVTPATVQDVLDAHLQCVLAHEAEILREEKEWQATMNDCKA